MITRDHNQPGQAGADTCVYKTLGVGLDLSGQSNRLGALVQQHVQSDYRSDVGLVYTCQIGIWKKTIGRASTCRSAGAFSLTALFL